MTSEVPAPETGRRGWWPGVGLAAVLTALATGWGITRDPLEPYYAAAVRAMASNWNAFLFGAFDPAATVTMDKLPGSFWVQALLVRARDGAPDLLAVQSSAVASVFAYPTGDEVLPIGGFTGTGPSPTLDRLRADVAAGRFHLVLSFPSTDPRFVWIDQHCRALHEATKGFVDHYCSPADAR